MRELQTVDTLGRWQVPICGCNMGGTLPQQNKAGRTWPARVAQLSNDSEHQTRITFTQSVCECSSHQYT
jgi:hypothetical protein